MSFQSIGDLAQSFQMRRDTARLTTEIAALTGELSSGESRTRGATDSGDFGPIAGLEAALARAQDRRLIMSETQVEFTAVQTTLATIQSTSQDLSGTFLLAPSAVQPTYIDAAAAAARRGFDAIIGGLNTSIGGRTLFAGTAVDGRATVPSDELLADLSLAVAGATTADDLRVAVQAWFAPGGGFETSAYQGDPESVVSRLESSDVRRPTALDAGLRDTLAAVALGALLDEGVFQAQPEERLRVAAQVGEDLVAAEGQLTNLRSSVGAVEEQLGAATSRLDAEANALTIARSELLLADPFETATALQSAESRLEALYLLTARQARLSLTAFLR